MMKEEKCHLLSLLPLPETYYQVVALMKSQQVQHMMLQELAAPIGQPNLSGGSPNAAAPDGDLSGRVRAAIKSDELIRRGRSPWAEGRAPPRSPRRILLLLLDDAAGRGEAARVVVVARAAADDAVQQRAPPPPRASFRGAPPQPAAARGLKPLAASSADAGPALLLGHGADDLCDLRRSLEQTQGLGERGAVVSWCGGEAGTKIGMQRQ